MCKDGYYLVRGSCIQCPADTIYDSDLGICRPICGINEEFSSTLRKCVCLSGYYLIGNSCKHCPSNTIYEERLGICRPICDINE